MKMKALIWSGEELGAKFDEVDIPEDLKELAQEYRDKLVEGVVEQDDAVSEHKEDGGGSGGARD